jgi:hypothetical protein
MASVFLSYARGDDDDFVARAYALLRSRGFEVWWDRESMPSRALTFTEEIRDAIHRSDRLVVVIGPKALRSDYVRAEWQAALSEHKPVIPVLRRVPEETQDPYACLPAELRHFHAPSFLVVDGAEPPLEPLERILREPVPPPAPIFGRPPERPPHFRPRLDKFAEIFGAVLGELTSTRVLTDEERVTVLTGMGGIGKTVLAGSLVEAMRTRPSTFIEDGIYWLSGSPLLRLAALCRVSTPDPLDEDGIGDAVSQQLDGKRFLLVVDDATSVAQIAPLVRVLGSGGRMLVTTRHGELAVGHQHIDLDQLSEEDALQLVADWLQVPVDAVLPEARRMVTLCGRHPFAIAVNAAAASQGLAWSTIITALERRELDFAQHRFEEYVYGTVEQSLEISVTSLPEPERARYRELAAFFWESGVPARAIARFWNLHRRLAEHRAQRLLVFLRQRSLLQLHGAPEDNEVRLHDLHRAYLQRDERQTASLGQALLETYQPPQRDAWWSVPDDGYFRRHVMQHLLRSRPASDVMALLSAEDDEQRNRWYRARVQGAPTGQPADGDGFAGYVADMHVASGRVSDCLLPLITASLRSLAGVVPGQLLAAAVDDERWSLARAIAHARLTAEPERRAAAMVALLPRVEDRASWLEETLDAIAQSDVTRRKALIEALAPVATPSELPRILRGIVAWVQHASSPYEETYTKPLVHHLLPRVPAPLLAEAIQLVSTIGIKPLRLYGALPEPERSARIREALDNARADEDDPVLSVAMQAWTVSELAEQLDAATAATLVAETLASARGLKLGEMRHQALLDLLGCVSPDDQGEILKELIADALSKPSKFKALAAQAPPALHARIREALEAQDLTWIANAAPAFAGDHREALVDRALAEIEAHENATSLLWIDGAALILAMNDRQLERARRVINARLDGDTRVRALIAVARAISLERRERALEEVLNAIDALAHSDERERAYQEIAPLLAPRQLAAALTAAERIGEPSGIEHLPKMLPYLSAPVREDATELYARFAGSVPFTTWLEGLRAIPRGLESDALDRLLELARELDVPEEAAQVLAVLTSRVTERERARAAEEARAAIARCESSRARFELLLELDDVEAAEHELKDAAPVLQPDELAQLVAMLAPHLSPERSDLWVRVALEADSGRGRRVLERLAPHLSLEQARGYLANLLGLVEAMNPHLPFVAVDDEAPTAAALARRLGGLGQADAAFALLPAGRNNDVTAMALVELAPHLAREQVLRIEDRVLSATFRSLTVVFDDSLWTIDGRNYLTGRLAPSLARVGEVEQALAYARATDAEPWRVPSYLGVAEATEGDTRTRVLLDALTTVQDLRDVFRHRQIDDVARAIAHDETAAAAAWPRAVEWARTHPRHEAIEMLASLAPIAAVVGGVALPDEVFRAIERVLRWWP